MYLSTNIIISFSHPIWERKPHIKYDKYHTGLLCSHIQVVIHSQRAAF